MTNLTVVTFDWVREMPRGYVRDPRVLWALEEAGLPYRVESGPFGERTVEHFRHQPFGQVPHRWSDAGNWDSGEAAMRLPAAIAGSIVQS